VAAEQKRFGLFKSVQAAQAEFGGTSSSSVQMPSVSDEEVVEHFSIDEPLTPSSGAGSGSSATPKVELASIRAADSKAEQSNP
jgi:hypothetical protein